MESIDGDRVLEQTQNISKQSKKALLWVASTTLVTQILSWVMTFWTAHILHPEDYGLIALAETIVPYLSLIASLNLATWIIQEASLTARDEKISFTFSISMGLLTASSLFLLAPYLSDFYDSAPLKNILQLLSISFVFRGLSAVPDALLRRELKFRELGIMTMVLGVFRGVIQIVLALNGWEEWALVLGILFREVAESIWIIAIRGLPRGLGFDWNVVRRILFFGLPLTGATLLWMAYSSADLIIVGKIFSTETLGFYSMALTIVGIPMSKISQVIRPVLLPYFSRLKEVSTPIAETFLKTNRFIAALVFPALVGLACVSNDLVPILLGSKWIPIIPILQVLAGVGILKSIVDIIPVAFSALGRPGLSFKINCAAAIYIPGILLIGASQFGLTGIYVSWFIAQGINTIVHFSILSPVINVSVKEQLLNLRFPFIVTILMALAVILVRNCLPQDLRLMNRLIAETVAGALVYMGGYRLLFPEEAHQVVRFVRNIRR